MWSTGRSVEEDTQAHPYSRALVQAIEREAQFGFCTEVLVRDCDQPLSDVKQRMEALGESVIVVGDRALTRVHVHTPRPGQVLEFAVDHGTLSRVKVENMELQHAALAASSREGADLHDGQRASSIGVIAVTAGDGLTRVFRSLGARVVPGGQSMNPSVQEILAAVNSSGYQELVLLPNNSNIILTARQVQELTPHRVSVVPTETVPQGIGALLAFNFQADMQTNVAAMEQAARAVHTVEVARAVRDTSVDELQVKTGDFLGICNGRVVASGRTATEALISALRFAPVDDMEIVTIYYGVDASATEAQAAAAEIRAAHGGLAVEVVEGGQPHYPFVASIE
jgi:DAK2 domain fusion protein YloV